MASETVRLVTRIRWRARAGLKDTLVASESFLRQQDNAVAPMARSVYLKWNNHERREHHSPPSIAVETTANKEYTEYHIEWEYRSRRGSERLRLPRLQSWVDVKFSHGEVMIWWFAHNPYW